MTEMALGAMLRGPCSTIKANRVVSQRAVLKGISRSTHKKVVFVVFVCLLALLFVLLLVALVALFLK